MTKSLNEVAHLQWAKESRENRFQAAKVEGHGAAWLAMELKVVREQVAGHRERVNRELQRLAEAEHAFEHVIACAERLAEGS